MAPEKSSSKKSSSSIFDLECSSYKVNTSGIRVHVYDEETRKSEYVLVTKTPCVITAIGRDIDTGELRYKLAVLDSLGHEHQAWKKTSDLMTTKGVLNLHDLGFRFMEDQ